jgi:DNA-binding transcriptional MocR family regulator
VWVPVPDEAVAVSRLLGAGWAVAPGSRFRMTTPAGIRVTISELTVDEIDPLADAVARAVHPGGRVIV